MRWVVALFLLGLNSACVTTGYEHAIGYRSRRAAQSHNAAAFTDLMQEAAEAEPKSHLDNPKKTVLTHFLDLAASPQFLATVDRWNQQGWVDADMVCPVYRAHFKAHFKSDPKAAARSAQTCLTRALDAAQSPVRQWEIDLCLLESPVLVQTATASLGPYLDLALDPDRPEPFRRTLLKALTFREQFGPRARWGQTSTLTPDAHRLRARSEGETWQRRLTWVLEQFQGKVPADELSTASARGALEVEQVATSFGASFIADYAQSPSAQHRSWAWGWVRTLKAQPPIEHLGGLGLWDRGREPAGDTYWYVCHGEPDRKQNALGTRFIAQGISVRATRPDPVLTEICARYSHVLGPYPLERTARAHAAQRLSARLGTQRKVVLRIQRRMNAPSQ
jgi:hypothetical protein